MQSESVTSALLLQYPPVHWSETCVRLEAECSLLQECKLVLAETFDGSCTCTWLVSVTVSIRRAKISNSHSSIGVRTVRAWLDVFRRVSAHT